MVSHPKSRPFKYLVPVIIVLVFTFPFRQCGKQEKSAGHPCDYTAIAREDIVHVTIEYNSVSFYVDSDTVSGFHYELVQASARDKGFKTEITPTVSFEGWLEGLSEGRYDVIAYGILAISKLKDSLLPTSPIFLNRQVLAQRKEIGESGSLYIRTQLDSVQRTLHVVKSSPSILRIQNLDSEIGDTICIRETDKYGSEQLISMVTHGNINYAICDESITLTVAGSLPQIGTNIVISFTQFHSWAIGKQSPVLLDSLNTWLDKSQKEKEYQKIYKKYYNKG